MVTVTYLAMVGEEGEEGETGRLMLNAVGE
jgi:hypothetical protein